jgi:CubicO group peptidase (beta-lactamase class C family)
VNSPFTPDPGIASDNPARLSGRPIGNAGLFSTADDLANYCRMVLNKGEYGCNRILSGKAIHAMCTKNDTCSPLSFGWFMDEKRNPVSFSKATLNHNGWAGNSIWIDPVQQCFVIVLTNRKGDHGKAISARIKLAELVMKAYLPVKLTNNKS